MEKSKNIISWGQLFIIFGTACLFLFALTTRVKFQEEPPKEIVYITDYQFNSGEITAYTGTDTILTLPSSYSIGPSSEKDVGIVTFYDDSEAFDFLIEHYAIGAEGYYDFYHELMTHEYPWVYEYSIDIPTYIEGDDYLVTSISARCFEDNKTIEKVIIPSSIQSIGNFAFQDCSNLAEIEFNEGLTFIGDSTFWGCAITELKLPTTLETIYPYAFFRCSKLETVVIPENVKNMTLGTFNACVSLKTVTILSPHEIEAWYTSVYHTFSNCTSLESVYVPAENLNYYKTTSPWSLYSSKYKTI